MRVRFLRKKKVLEPRRKKVARVNAAQWRAQEKEWLFTEKCLAEINWKKTDQRASLMCNL